MKKKGHLKLPPPVVKAPTLTTEEEQELDFHVCCCIEEIENILSKNSTEKQKKLGEISLRILRNPAEPFIKKKQVMRQWFGDYKDKFHNKKSQLLLNLNENKCTFKKTETPLKSVCYRKHELKKIEQDVSDSKDLQNFSSMNEKESCVIEDSNNSFRFQF